jgi:hypothetical protein
MNKVMQVRDYLNLCVHKVWLRSLLDVTRYTNVQRQHNSASYIVL